MPNTPVVQDRAFHDVFISYRHRDDERIDRLERQIRCAGFTPFRDLNFPELRDTSDVTRAKIETIRQQLSRSTCLIFAYSHASAMREQEAGLSLGVWMPWELGFFDGAISSRIGVYLLDGPRGAEDPKAYFKGSEYLQLYEELTADNLQVFLERNAVRERRIDNVASAFVWLEHLLHECMANPTNVSLGVAEWFADHAGRFWQAQGNSIAADACAQLKVALDDTRVTTVPALRFRLYDELVAAALTGRLPADVAQNRRPAGPSAAAPATYAPRGVPVADAGFDALQQQMMKAWKPFLLAAEKAINNAQPGGQVPETDLEPRK